MHSSTKIIIRITGAVPFMQGKLPHVLEGEDGLNGSAGASAGLVTKLKARIEVTNATHGQCSDYEHLDHFTEQASFSRFS